MKIIGFQRNVMLIEKAFLALDKHSIDLHSFRCELWLMFLRPVAVETAYCRAVVYIASRDLRLLHSYRGSKKYSFML